MAKIILVGQDDIQLNKERAEEIKQDWKDGKYNKDDKIEVGDNSIRTGDIRSIRIEKKSRYDKESISSLSTEEIKNQLGDFEEKYEEHKSGELKTYERLGVMDIGVHDWLEEKGAISGKDIDPELYSRFSDKKELLGELNYRREFAEKKDKEDLERLAKSGK